MNMRIGSSTITVFDEDGLESAELYMYLNEKNDGLLAPKLKDE